jgi:hypothetical protein
MKLKFAGTDNDSRRVYYKDESNLLYCFEDVSRRGPIAFRFMLCTGGGRPLGASKIQPLELNALPPPSDTGRTAESFRAWIAAGGAIQESGTETPASLSPRPNPA